VTEINIIIAKAPATIPTIAPTDNLLPVSGLKSTWINDDHHHQEDNKKEKSKQDISANLVNLLGVTDMAEIRGPYSPLCGMELVPFPAQ